MTTWKGAKIALPTQAYVFILLFFYDTCYAPSLFNLSTVLVAESCTSKDAFLRGKPYTAKDNVLCPRVFNGRIMSVLDRSF